MAYSAPSSRTTGDIITASIWNQDVVDNVEALYTGVGQAELVFPFDGGGAAITANKKIYMPYRLPDLLLTEWDILSDQSGSIQFDVWVAARPDVPTNANSICGGHEPLLSSAQVGEDTDIADWGSTTIVEDSYIIVNVDSCTTITASSLVLVGLRDV